MTIEQRVDEAIKATEDLLQILKDRESGLSTWLNMVDARAKRVAQIFGFVDGYESKS